MDVLPAEALSVPSERIFSSSKERDCTISGPVTPRAVDDLVAAGKLPELDELLKNAREIDCNSR
jgi:hypothetical protein